MHNIDKSGERWETGVRIYEAYNSPVNTSSVIQLWTQYNKNKYKLLSGFDANSVCIYCSSGFEDFYLSSWNAGNIKLYNTKSSGLTYQSKNSIDSTTTISILKNFTDSMPCNSTGRKLVVTLNSRDASGQSGSYTVIGQLYFYA